ncbi:hypothetical protein TNCV_4356371 [Trichonephila clavipes]|nr:hypothetical protein TNCV_4356371 [Trichonephila clavipes]
MVSHKFTSQSQGQADNLNTQGYSNSVFWDRHGVLSFGWEQIDHPPSQFRLGSESDFHLFRYLKEFLGGKRFDTAEEVKEEVQRLVYPHRAADVYRLRAWQKLVERYDKCLNKYGKISPDLPGMEKSGKSETPVPMLGSPAMREQKKPSREPTHLNQNFP